MAKFFTHHKNLIHYLNIAKFLTHHKKLIHACLKSFHDKKNIEK